MNPKQQQKREKQPNTKYNILINIHRAQKDAACYQQAVTRIQHASGNG